MWALAALLLVLVVAAVGFLLWANTPNPVMPEGLEGLQSTMWVEVTTSKAGWLVFTPLQRPNIDTGFIFYPGVRVDPRAYAPPIREIARAGYLVVIVPMPLNMAVLDHNAANRVMAAFPDIERWAVGGHSLGGMAATQFVAENPGAVQGLALWAPHPGADLSTYSIPTTVIYGTRDGLLSRDTIEGERARLPADTIWVPIEGGNHAQFGYYGDQAGDNPAQIGRWAQQEQVIAGTIALLEQIKEQTDNDIIPGP
ncbi:MAG: alpha/beta hydrolase [Anaerolineae bacterium]|nr:alpha/beta hydrolase [Anaerolineae bacterium]